MLHVFLQIRANEGKIRDDGHVQIFFAHNLRLVQEINVEIERLSYCIIKEMKWIPFFLKKDSKIISNF